MKSNILKYGIISAIFAFSATGLAKVSCKKVPSEKCERLKNLIKEWPSKDLEEVEFVVVQDTNEVQENNNNERKDFEAEVSEHSESNVDVAAAGPCRFVEDQNAVEIEKRVLDFSDFGIANCISIGAAGAIYNKIEQQWLSHIGEQEAWIIRKGTPEKVNLSEKRLEASLSRQVWTSLASREMIQYYESKTTIHENDAIPTDGRVLASGNRTTSDPFIKGLLGL